MKRTKSAGLVAVAALGLLVATNVKPVSAQDSYKTQLDRLRQSLEKYQDYKVAVRDLYLSTVGCIYYSGEKIAGYMEYPKGAMGVHFVNLTVQGPPDPMKPNVLIYEPVGKELKLEGHEQLIPKEYVHYDLHAWVLKNNPLGMFAPTNPDVNCEGYDYALLEKPTKMIHGP